MQLFPRSIIITLVISFVINLGLVTKTHAKDTLDSIIDVLSGLTCETQGVGDLLRSEFSHTCIVAPFFTFAVMNLVSPVLYMNTFLKLKINDNDLFSKNEHDDFGYFPGGQCTRENRIDPNKPELRFALCSNAKLIVARAGAVAKSALAIAKAVLTGSDPWDDIKEAWKNNKKDYYVPYSGKPGDDGFAFDVGFPVIYWKVIQDKDRICVSTKGFTGDVPVGCKYMKEPFPKSMYNNFMDVGDKDLIENTNKTPTDPLALVSCSSAGGGCYQKAYNASKTAVVMTSPLIECIRQMIARLLISKDVCSFDNVSQVINLASRQDSALFQFQVRMYKIVAAFLTLYVMFFGFKLLLAGEVPPKSEYINFILKMIFVTYFSIGINITPGSGSPYDRLDGMIQWAFPFLLDGINALASWVMNAAPSNLCKFNGPGISYDGSVSYIALWDALDCRVAHYLGLDILSTLLVENAYRSHDFLNFDFFSFSAPPYIYLLIPAIISGNMMLVSLALAYPLLVISVAAFMVNATIMCMISIVILGILAPLFVPMFLFTYTRNYFDSWVKLMISFLLQPMVVVTFMITMFSVYDYGFYGKCQYKSKLIHNSIENLAQGSTSSRDVLIFYINNDWNDKSQYPTNEDVESCQNSLGYMLNNPITTAFNFTKNSVSEIVGSKSGDTSTDKFLAKFQFLSGVILGPGMFFMSPKVVFEKIKNILLALVTACFTLYLMYHVSSQLAEFAADMTEGVALNNVAIKPQAIFKAAMALSATVAGAATKGLDQVASRRGGVSDLAGGLGGEVRDNVAASGGVSTPTVMQTTLSSVATASPKTVSSEARSDVVTTTPASPEVVSLPSSIRTSIPISEPQSNIKSESARKIISDNNQESKKEIDNTPPLQEKVDNASKGSGVIDYSFNLKEHDNPTGVKQIRENAEIRDKRAEVEKAWNELVASGGGRIRDQQGEEISERCANAEKVWDELVKNGVVTEKKDNSATNKFDKLADELNKLEKAKVEENQNIENDIKEENTTTSPQEKINSTSKGSGVIDYSFNLKEHDNPTGVKQIRENAEIRDKRAEVEKAWNELVASGGGRIRDQQGEEISERRANAEKVWDELVKNGVVTEKKDNSSNENS
ncbi:type IV secretion system protein [Rickettsia canadensis]|uniref:TrbL/VirB6 plasmid conjugative transfer protein n=1 Tax=Rickettsia canadensis str. CA410 TaxID=1105107 RepID=A0ABM5MQS8_RICCA|nr:type IV secretion system protein [Rickettsia canadensis]AFB20677.1 TrbL/VirB6 plasmid conjugative transfer protein [Rickettsia canadensis str. CA410]